MWIDSICERLQHWTQRWCQITTRINSSFRHYKKVAKIRFAEK